MVRELEQVGPNFAEIARRLNQPEETVRRTFKSTIEKHGYVVHAGTNSGVLGLREVYALVDIADEFQEKVEDIVSDMDDHWFLSGFYRTLPDGKFLLRFSIPEDHYDEAPAMLSRMTEVGLISKTQRVLRTSWVRYRPMSADLFDFRRGRWEFDWTRIPTNVPISLPHRSPRRRFDSTDIAIMFHLMLNANTPLKEIAKRLRVSGETASMHAEHIARAGLISWYRVNWNRAQVNLETGRPFAPRHRLGLWTLVSSVTPEELARLSERFNALPFMWLEAGGQDYAAQFVVPLEQTVEVLSYFREVLRPVADRSATYVADPACSRGYSAPLYLVDDSRGDWIFDLDSQISRLKEQLEVARREMRRPGGEGAANGLSK